MCKWYLLEGNELFYEDDFIEDFYQDRNYEVYHYPCTWDESDVWKAIQLKLSN